MHRMDGVGQPENRRHKMDYYKEGPHLVISGLLSFLPIGSDCPSFKLIQLLFHFPSLLLQWNMIFQYHQVRDQNFSLWIIRLGCSVMKSMLLLLNVVELRFYNCWAGLCPKRTWWCHYCSPISRKYHECCIEWWYTWNEVDEQFYKSPSQQHSICS